MLSFEKTIDEIVSQNPDLAILPVGSIEQHGAHLPVGTDWYIATAVGRLTAERTGGYLLPALPVSTCREHMGKKGSVWMDPDIFYNMILSMVSSLKEQGFRRVLTLQCHGGIFILPPTVRQANALHNPDLMMVNIDFGYLPKEITGFGEGEIHAGESETSLMLHIAPETVHMDRAVTSWPTVPRPYLNYGSIFRASPSGVWGDPTIATAEKGEKILTAMADWAAQEANKAFSYMQTKEKFGYSNF